MPTRAAIAFTALAALLASCSRGGPALPHAIGTDSFTSQPPGGLAASAAQATSAAGGQPAPSANAPASSSASAPRVLEEADLYQLSGTHLFVLNAYRGLEIVDLANPSAPALVGRVPLSGTPVDLYLLGTVAYLTESDAFAYVPEADGVLRPQRDSRLVAVDVTDPTHPVVLADFPIAGALDQTRLVGNVLYVMSRDSWWYAWAVPLAAGTTASPSLAEDGPSTPDTDLAYVASFDVSDPAHPIAVAKLEFPASGFDTHANVTVDRVTLSFSGWDASGPVTRFQVVDISDPGGALSAGASFSCPGLVEDRWAMDYDATGGNFRAVLAGDWNGGAALEIWSSPSPVAATPLARLSLDVGQSLTAASFDGARVYIVTALAADPLFAVDASDPSNPVVAGTLAMPGALDFIEPRGDRLLALGHTSEAGQSFQLAVTLIDVTELASPKELSRVEFGSSYGFVATQADELNKAFIVLDPPPAGIGLVLVPVQGWDGTTYAYTGGTQLIDYSGDSLTLRGFLAHPGAITRSFPTGSSGTTLAALSDSALQIIDATNRDAPVQVALLELARSVATLAILSGDAIELAGDYYLGATELVVTDALDPDAATPLASVSVPAPYAALFEDGTVFWLLAHDVSANTAWLQAVDLAQPLSPVLRGRLDLDQVPSLGGGFWGYGDEAVLVGHTLAVHRYLYLVPQNCPAGAPCPLSATDAVRLYDLSDPDHPRWATDVVLPGSAWSWGLTAFGSYLWLTEFEWQAGEGSGRYYLDRIDLSNPSQPALLARINVPGVLFAASSDGSLLYTLETWWSSDTTTTYVHGLSLTAAGTARLFGTAPLSGYPAGATASSGYAFVATEDPGVTFAVSGTAASPASGGAVLGPVSGPGSAHLFAVDLAAMAVSSAQEVKGSYAWLRKVSGGTLFLEAGWLDQGILVYSLADPAHPAFQQSVRTQGYPWDIVVANGIAYLPSGPYGVPMVTLGGP